MAVFGVPVVHEDDALRACRAAVEIRDRLAALDAQIRADRGATIEWRMGINTGEVVAGDVRSRPADCDWRRGERGRPLGGCRDAGRDPARGGDLRPGQSRGDGGGGRAADAEGQSPSRSPPGGSPASSTPRAGMPGRLKLRWSVVADPCACWTTPSARRSRSASATCSPSWASPGVGKSRLVEEFIGSLGDQAQLAAGRCLAYGHGITYWPVAEAIRHGAGIAESDPPERASPRACEMCWARSRRPSGSRPSSAACSASRTARRRPTRCSGPSARPSRPWLAADPWSSCSTTSTGASPPSST